MVNGRCGLNNFGLHVLFKFLDGEKQDGCISPSEMKKGIKTIDNGQCTFPVRTDLVKTST